MSSEHISSSGQDTRSQERDPEMAEQAVDTIAQQLLAGIISSIPLKPKSQTAMETSVAPPPPVAHFARPPSSDTSPSAGFVFSKAPPMPTNYGRRPMPKTNIMLEQDTSNAIESNIIGEEATSPTSLRLPMAEPSASAGTQSSTETIDVVEQNCTTATRTVSPTTERKSSPTALTALDAVTADFEMTSNIERRGSSADPHTPAEPFNQDRADPNVKTSYSEDVTRSTEKTGVGFANHPRKSARRSSNRAQHRSGSSLGQNQISSENLLKIVLHRQQEQTNLESELIQELRSKDDLVSQLLQNESAVRGSLESAKDHILALESDLTSKTDLVGRLNEKAEKLQDFVKGLGHDHEILKEEMGAVLSSVEDVKQQKTDLIAALSETRDSVETLNDRRRDSLLKASHQLELVDQALRCKEQQCEDLTRLLASERDRMKSLVEQMQVEGERSRAGLDAAYSLQINSLREEHCRLRGDLNQRDHALKLAEEAKDHLKVSVERFSSEIKRLEMELEALRATAHKRLENIDQIKEQHRQLEVKLRESERELENVRLRYDSMAERRKTLDGRIDELNREKATAGELVESKQREVESLNCLVKSKDNELLEIGVLREKALALESERDSFQKLLSMRDDALQKSQNLVNAQMQKLHCIPLLEGRLESMKIEWDGQKQALQHKEIELNAAKESLEDRCRKLKQMVSYQTEAHRLTQVLTQRDHEVVNQKHELELARAALRSYNTNLLELTAAKARIQTLEDEQAKLNDDLVSKTKRHDEIQANLASRERELQGVIAAQAREISVNSTEISALKSQLEERNKLVKSHEKTMQEAKKQAELRDKEIEGLRKLNDPLELRKSVAISDQVSTITTHKSRHKADRDVPDERRITLVEESQVGLEESQDTAISCIPDPYSVGASQSHIPSPGSEDELQYIASSPMLEEYLRDLSQTPVLDPVDATDAKGLGTIRTATKTIAEDSQAIDTQQGAFLLKMPEPKPEIKENAQEVGHTTKLDLAAERRAKKQPVENSPRPSLQPPNTSNKRKHTSLPAVSPDSQSRSVQQSGPRSILKTSTSQTKTSTTEVCEMTGHSQAHQKKQRRSGVQDLGPILSSSPTASFSTNGRRKLSHRSTKRSDKFSQKFNQESAQAA